MIITRTPYRLSFFGGGTDYPVWFEKNGGLVIGSTFKRYCYISCRYLPPFFDHKTRLVYSKLEDVKNNDDIQHIAVRACLKYLKVEDGLEIHHDGDLPARSGLGSSSSFTVGMLLALHGLRHEMPSTRQLADEAIYVEQTLLAENVGVQDQILAAHGGMQVIELGPGRETRISPLILPPDYVTNLENHILLGFSGLTRTSSEIAKAQVNKMEKGESRVGEMFDIAKEALTLFRKKAEISQLGNLLDQSWQLKRSLGANVSTPMVDEMLAVAKNNGAYGGKLLGAGGGGFMMFLAPPEKHEQIKKALAGVKVWVPFKFDNQGAQVILHNDEY